MLGSHLIKADGQNNSTPMVKHLAKSLKDKKVFKTTYTKEINIQSHAKLYGNQTSDIGSYHVGSFYFDKNATYNISLKAGHARACRVIIDDMIFSEKTM